MNLNQRRPTGTHLTLMDKMTKRDLVSFMGERGLTLFVSKNNRGEWNECREFHCRDEAGSITTLDNVSKGDKPDWDYMFSKLPGTK